MVFCCIVFVFTAVSLPTKMIYAQEITLYWASFLPKNHPETVDIQKYYIDRVNERAKGQLVIKYRGGPEVMAPPDLGTAVKNGVVDLCTTTVGYYEAIVPGVGGLMLTELTPDEEQRPGGANNYIIKLHRDHGLVFLGRAAAGKEPFFYFFLNKKIEKPDDFTRFKLGCATALRAASKAWGASVVPLKLSEYYTAMERNLVDGIPGCPIPTWVAFGCHEVTKYVLDYQFYQSTAMAIMNPKSWEKLPEGVKKIMNETMVDYQKVKMEVMAQSVAKSRQKMKAAGVEFYKLSPEHGNWLVKTAYDAAWDYQHERFPKVTEDLRKHLSK